MVRAVPPVSAGHAMSNAAALEYSSEVQHRPLYRGVPRRVGADARSEADPDADLEI
jgi:hypothetical protein